MAKVVDLTGQRFGRLQVIDRAETPKVIKRNGDAVAIVALSKLQGLKHLRTGALSLAAAWLLSLRLCVTGSMGSG
jgi:hypothetical protein